MSLTIIYNSGTGDFTLGGGSFTELQYKGTILGSGQLYPPAVQGDFYLVSRAGSIGGNNGIAVAERDVLVALAFTVGGKHEDVGNHWSLLGGDPLSLYTGGSGLMAASVAEIDAAAANNKAVTPFNIDVRYGHIDAVEKHLVWDTPQSPARTPKGTKGDPHRVNSAALFNQFWLDRNNMQTVFLYQSGEFQTNGYYFGTFHTARSNHRHFGQGEGNTVIKLVNSDTNFKGAVFKSGPHLVEDFEIGHLTIDCNGDNQPVTDLRTVEGISLQATNRAYLHDLRIIGWGSFVSDAEAFPCVCEPGAGFDNQTFRDVVFDRIAMSSPCASLGTCTAMYHGAQYQLGIKIMDFVIRNCFIDVPSGVFSTVNAMSGAEVHDNVVRIGDSAIGIYYEPALPITRPIHIKNNTVHIGSGSYGIRVLSSAAVANVIVENNLVVLGASTVNSYGISHAGTGLMNGVFAGNTFALDDGVAPGDIAAGSTYLSFRGEVERLTIKDSTFGAGPPNDIELESAKITDSSFLGNRRTDGSNPVVYDYNSAFKSFAFREETVAVADAGPGLFVGENGQLYFKDANGNPTQLTFPAP